MFKNIYFDVASTGSSVFIIPTIVWDEAPLFKTELHLIWLKKQFTIGFKKNHLHKVKKNPLISVESNYKVTMPKKKSAKKNDAKKKK